MSELAAFEVALFDLGGVIVELGGPELHGPLLGLTNPDEITAAWHQCPVLADYECGLITSTEFATAMIRRYGLAMAPDAFLAAYVDWALRIHPAAVDALARLVPEIRPACFSNIGELHWATQNVKWGYDAMFDVRLASFELGVRKPDARAFELALERLGCAPAAVLYLDDNAANVEAGQRAGFSSHLVKGGEAVRDLLDGFGLLV
jgi:HAD superfamily hydrolase (TIGR01509 family)